MLHSDNSIHLEDYPPEIARILTYIGGTPIVAAPYSGVRTPFDGAHLITNFPKTRLDMNVLTQRQAIQDFLASQGVPIVNRPFVEISGDLEIIGVIENPSGASTTAKIDYSELEIDITAAINPWVTGFVSILLDAGPAQTQDNPTIPTSKAPASIVDNSNLFLEVGFLTIGNLDKNPFFLTVGQTYVPFGRLTNYFINVMTPRALARTKARNIALGYKQPGDDGFYAIIFAFESDTRSLSPTPNGILGGTLAYAFHEENFSGELGAGVISNIADSVGMQRAAGFGTNAATEMLQHDVPALNGYARLNVGNFGFLAEYIGTTRAFSPLDLSYNNHGAKPQTWDTQVAYFFDFFNRPTAIAFVYSGSSEALALALPRHRLALTFNTSLWRNTVQMIELRRDITYAGGTQAAGPTLDANGNRVPASTPGSTDTSAARFARSTSAITFVMAAYY